jgi:hypothetical protein
MAHKYVDLILINVTQMIASPKHNYAKVCRVCLSGDTERDMAAKAQPSVMPPAVRRCPAAIKN